MELLYFSVHVFRALERAACLLLKRLWYSEKGKHCQGTVAALGFAPKSGHCLANLKITYASPEQLSLLDSHSGGRNSNAYLMEACQCLLFFQRFKKAFSYFLVPQNDSKIQKKDFAPMFQPYLFLRFFFFPQETLPSTLSGKGKLLAHRFSDAPGMNFFQRRL